MTSRQTKRQYDIYRNLPSRSSHDSHKFAEKVANISEEEKRRGFSFKRTLASFLLIVFLFFLVIGVWDAMALSKASQKMFGSGNIFSLLLGSDLARENGRTNILLIGYSADDPGHQGASLTDSIMLISLDSKTKDGYILSIPRDLYVEIPGNGHAKINEAYQDGNAQGFNKTGYPSGGAGLLEKIITDNFGVPIHYYALVNYAAFRDTVNALGGVTVNIQSSDPRGLYDPNISPVDGGPLMLTNGPHKLDGQTALNLARARGEAYNSYGFPQNDFDRTEHQRQLLIALRQKSVSWKTALNPVKAGHLFDGMASNVKTDINTNNVLPLYGLLNKVSFDKLKSYSLRDLNGQNLLTGYDSYSAGSALIPSAGIDDFSQIQSAVSSLNQ